MTFADWQRLKIGQLGRVVTGKTPPSGRPELFGQDHPFITPSDIDGVNRVADTERFISNAGATAFRNQMIPTGSVCFVCIGATIGKMCIATRPSLTNQQINTVVVDAERHDAKFVYYVLKQLAPDVKSLAGGAATPIISKSSFSEIEVTVAPKEKQRRIASILSAYDDLIENNTRRIAILEEMARRIYEEWFVRFRFPGHERARMVESKLGLLPQGWEPQRLDSAFIFGAGKAINKADREGGDVPVYGANGIIGYTTLAPLSTRCVVLGKIGSCGALHRPIKPCFVTNNAFFVQPQKGRSFEFMELTLSTIDYRQYIGGAANPYLPLPSFGHHLIIRPHFDVEEQFCRLVAPMFSQQTSLLRSCANLRTTRDLLLPKLITGELDVSALPEPEAATA